MKVLISFTRYTSIIFLYIVIIKPNILNISERSLKYSAKLGFILILINITSILRR